MPPKTVFSRDDVVNAAFEIVKKGGLNDLSARRIAEELNSSTAPVYSCFKSMDELRNEVFNKAEEMMIEYTTRPYTRSVFLNMGTGLALFARDNRELFRALLLEGSETRTVLKKFLKFLRDELVKDDLISKLPEKDRNEVMRRMAIFTHGFASLICVGLIDDVNKNMAIKTMYDMGRDVIDYAFIKAGIQMNDPNNPRHGQFG